MNRPPSPAPSPVNGGRGTEAPLNPPKVADNFGGRPETDLFSGSKLAVEVRLVEKRVTYFAGPNSFHFPGYPEVSVGLADLSKTIVIGIVSAEGANHQYHIDSQELVQECLRLHKIRMAKDG